MAKKEAAVYEEVIQITYKYLGPATDRFIARQTQHHLNKVPEAMTASDLRKLIDWISIAVSLLTDDSRMVEEYIAQLEEIALPLGKKGGKDNG